MKSIKEWSFKYWILVYVALMIVLGILSTILSKQGINIHASFIFIAVVLVHLVIAVKRIISNEKKLLRQLFILLLLLTIVKVALLEFYHTLKAVDTAYGVLIIILVVAFVYTSITDRIAKKKADKQKMEETLKREELKEPEVIDTADIPADENTEEPADDMHKPVEEENDEGKDTV